MPAELRIPRSDSWQQLPDASVAAPSLHRARQYAARGWPVHPLAPGRKTPAGNCDACRRPGHTRHNCACRAAGRWCHGFHAATLEEDRLNRWWGANPEMGIGVACGPADLVVIDIDAHAGQPPTRDRILPGITIGEHINLAGLSTGFHTLAVLAALRGQTSPADDTTTLRVRTPSGGLHVWYRATDRRRWQCSTGSGRNRALAWQIDIRAHGGYIVAPGTTTNDGTYTPLDGTDEPAPLPAWLAAELERTGHLSVAQLPAPRSVPSRARQAVLAAGGGRNQIYATLTSALAAVAACGQVAQGAGFSDTLNRASYTLGGLIAAGALSQASVENALLETAAAARPGQEQRVAQIIRSGLTAGMKRPLHPGRGR
ncbi:bifunctional DNA primase/polymerase [Streptomyces sp. NPDC058471]|uniref:bifunctional DNA primase/polymerase n=1 Tax=Streptomyces sp. NPDC058471 TaxID=3346516 RepID=UPI0036473DA0